MPPSRARWSLLLPRMPSVVVLKVRSWKLICTWPCLWHLTFCHPFSFAITNVMSWSLSPPHDSGIHAEIQATDFSEITKDVGKYLSHLYPSCRCRSILLTTRPFLQSSTRSPESKTSATFLLSESFSSFVHIATRGWTPINFCYQHWMGSD